MFSALWAQSLMVLLAAVAWGVWQGWRPALDMLFGGAVSLANTGLLVLRWWRGLTEYHCNGPRHLKGFRRSNLERFFVVIVLLAAGLYWVAQQPGLVLTGFILGQLAWIVAIAVLRAD